MSRNLFNNSEAWANIIATAPNATAWNLTQLPSKHVLADGLKIYGCFLEQETLEK